MVTKIGLHEFPPMTGPYEKLPVGSYQWAESISARLEMHVRHVSTNSINRVLDIVREVFRTDPRPWTIWPKPPYGTPDKYFQAVTGHGVNDLLNALEELGKNNEETLKLVREARAEIAEINPVRVGQHGAPPMAERNPNAPDGGNRNKGGNSKKDILARLAGGDAKCKKILAAYKRGEYKSARAAGIAAGFIKPPTPLDLLRKNWEKASKVEQQTFRNEIGASDHDR